MRLRRYHNDIRLPQRYNAKSYPQTNNDTQHQQHNTRVNSYTLSACLPRSIAAPFMTHMSYSSITLCDKMGTKSGCDG